MCIFLSFILVVACLHIFTVFVFLYPYSVIEELGKTTIYILCVLLNGVMMYSKSVLLQSLHLIYFKVLFVDYPPIGLSVDSSTKNQLFNFKVYKKCQLLPKKKTYVVRTPFSHLPFILMIE